MGSYLVELESEANSVANDSLRADIDCCVGGRVQLDLDYLLSKH